MSEARSQVRRSDRDLFADGPIWRLGDWICTAEWIAHHGLALPQEWLGSATRPRLAGFADAIDRYVAAASNGQRELIRFNPPQAADELGWTYQSIKGKAPLAVNAAVREFFEALTPGSRWYFAPVAMRYHGEPHDGFIVARVHRELGVRFAVAGCDSRLPR